VESELEPDAPLLEGIVLLPEELVSEAPLLPLLIPEEPEEPDDAPDVEDGVVCVVVVVTVAGALLPDDDAPLPDEVALLPEVSEAEPGVVAAAPLGAGSLIVVVVVVDCPKVAVAVPISDRKMARGNFFMLAPMY
jgi:hypothetical protein